MVKFFNLFLDILVQVLWNTKQDNYSIIIKSSGAHNAHRNVLTWKNNFGNIFITVSPNKSLHKILFLHKRNITFLSLIFYPIISFRSYYLTLSEAPTVCSLIFCKILSDKNKKPLKSIFCPGVNVTMSVSVLFFGNISRPLSFNMASFILRLTPLE